MPTSILAVDTATEICGVALTIDGRVQAELILNQGVTHTRSVLAAIDAVLGISGLAPADVDAFAVTRGPGSFTGLRIGISTVKALSLSGAKPLVGISSLEVLAHQASGSSTLICPMMDARRREVYWALYRRDADDIAPVHEERVGPVSDIVDAIGESCQFIGNGVALYRMELLKGVTHPVQWARNEWNDLRPAVLARLAWERFKAGKTCDVGTFAPVYLRKSDAELDLASRTPSAESV